MFSGLNGDEAGKGKENVPPKLGEEGFGEEDIGEEEVGEEGAGLLSTAGVDTEKVLNAVEVCGRSQLVWVSRGIARLTVLLFRCGQRCPWYGTRSPSGP